MLSKRKASQTLRTFRNCAFSLNRRGDTNNGSNFQSLGEPLIGNDSTSRPN